MPTPVNIGDLISEFTSDLEGMPVRDVVRKYISTGQPVAFTGSDYYLLRQHISREFNIHPASVVVVGSTRTGFSLNPKHRFRAVRDKSDIDVAIVSPELFDEYWDKVFAYSQANVAWASKGFKRTLFKGWIDPRELPDAATLQSRWATVFDNLMQSRRFGIRRITARLYRTWERLEQYQERSVFACKASTGRSHD